VPLEMETSCGDKQAPECRGYLHLLLHFLPHPIRLSHHLHIVRLVDKTVCSVEWDIECVVRDTPAFASHWTIPQWKERLVQIVANGIIDSGEDVETLQHITCAQDGVDNSDSPQPLPDHLKFLESQQLQFSSVGLTVQHFELKFVVALPPELTPEKLLLLERNWVLDCFDSPEGGNRVSVGALEFFVDALNEAPKWYTKANKQGDTYSSKDVVQKNLGVKVCVCRNGGGGVEQTFARMLSEQECQ